MKYIYGLAILLATASCARQQTSQNDQFTLGQVQMKIEKGMSQTEVAQLLGAPNIVTQDSDGRQAWVYDKMGSSVEYYNRSGGFWLVIVGTGGSRGGATTSQKTLTVVIKFDKNNEVSNVTYHSSHY